MQSPKSATTPRRLTLGWSLNLPIVPGDADWPDAIMAVFVAISLLILYKLFSNAVAFNISISIIYLGGKYLVFLSSRSVKMRDRFLSFLSLYIFEESVFIFQFLNAQLCQTNPNCAFYHSKIEK